MVHEVEFCVPHDVFLSFTGTKSPHSLRKADKPVLHGVVTSSRNIVMADTISVVVKVLTVGSDNVDMVVQARECFGDS